MNIDTKLEWDEDKVTRDFEAKANRGIGAAAKFLASRIEEAISRPAPTETYVTKSGKTRKRATVRATPGAPPRVVSGALKRSVGWELVVERMAVARVGVFSGQVELDLDPDELEPWEYGGIHEHSADEGDTSGHPFIRRTLERYRTELERIVGGEVVTGRE